MFSKAAAIHNVMNGFGIDAYPATAVPIDAQFPFLTYTLTTGSLRDGEQNITVNVWHKTDSEAAINSIVTDIERIITSGGVMVQCSGGAVWVKRGVPWCQAMDTEDNTLKRRYLNFDVEYLTED